MIARWSLAARTRPGWIVWRRDGAGIVASGSGRDHGGHHCHGRDNAFDRLTPREERRLAWFANAYHAEAAFGADDGKRWAFARYLAETRRLTETADSGTVQDDGDFGRSWSTPHRAT